MSGSVPARLAASVAVAGLLVASALTGCGRAGTEVTQDSAQAPAASQPVEYTDLSWEAQALEAVGFAAAELRLADAEPTRSAERRQRPQALRYERLRLAFGRHTLHGEAVIQTQDGTRTVVVQRGTVAEIDSDSITVKSADGYTLTWSFGEPLRVIERRHTIEPTRIKVGTTVGVAGARENGSAVARLIVVAAR